MPKPCKWCNKKIIGGTPRQKYHAVCRKAKKLAYTRQYMKSYRCNYWAGWKWKNPFVVKQDRICLQCGETFASEGPLYRICDRCKQTRASNPDTYYMPASHKVAMVGFS